MKNQFFAYFKKSDEEFKELWEKAIFAIDANVLLNLYRYSKAAQEILINALKVRQNQLFLPNQAGEEFFSHRINFIINHEKKYDDFIKNLKNLLIQLENQREHPFVSNDNLNDFSKSVDKLIFSLEREKKEFTSGKEDLLLEKIAALFKERVGEPLNDEHNFETNAKFRFDNKIPPGYADNKKDSNKKYGDLKVWKQIIEYAKKIKSLLFLSLMIEKKIGGLYPLVKHGGQDLNCLRNLKQKLFKIIGCIQLINF